METEISVAYIQKDDCGEFINLSAYNAWQGFKQLNIKTEFFNYNQLKSGFLNLYKSTLVCGYISSVLKAFEQIEVKEPEFSDYPKELESFLGRKIWTSALKEIKEYTPKVFIKPKQAKLFNGHIRSGDMKDLINSDMQLAMCPDETEIYVSEPVKFISEYRIFVNEGLMVGCQHYFGDFTICPDFEIITDAINVYKNSPTAYN